MDKAILKSFMALHNDTQETLAEALGISLSRLNAKINETNGAEFNKREIVCIKNRYSLKPKDIDAIFFA